MQTMPCDIKDTENGLQITFQGICINMIRVQGGSFWMSSQKKDPSGQNYDKDEQASDDESPVHQVSVDDFYLGETEVNQKLWEVVMGNNPSRHIDVHSDLPVDSVSWYDCQKFIEKLNEITGMTFRLPKEAEWEYAAIGGKTGQQCKYSGGDKLSAYRSFCRLKKTSCSPMGHFAG